MGVFDAVSRGTAQMGHGAAYYWQGKNPACAFFSAVPFGLTASEMNGWLQYGGGQKLWDELYAPFNLMGFAAGNTGVQMGGWFNKEINTIEDFKGLKMRMPGLGGKVLNQLGSAVVTLSGGEITQAMQTGTIDATEWVGPYNDLAFGLHKVSKFYYWPGWHEPGTTLECMVNKQEFEKLPKHLQAVVRYACQSVDSDMQAEFAAKNSTALNQLVQQHKVKLKKFPDPVLKKLGELSEGVVAEVAKANPTATKIHKSFQSFKNCQRGLGKISESAYAQARSLTL
ncbi:MAG: TRAP transporter substrate-binding protein [Bdellovibrionales bacterium]